MNSFNLESIPILIELIGIPILITLVSTLILNNSIFNLYGRYLNYKIHLVGILIQLIWKVLEFYLIVMFS